VVHGGRGRRLGGLSVNKDRTRTLKASHCNLPRAQNRTKTSRAEDFGTAPTPKVNLSHVHRWAEHVIITNYICISVVVAGRTFNSSPLGRARGQRKSLTLLNESTTTFQSRQERRVYYSFWHQRTTIDTIK